MRLDLNAASISDSVQVWAFHPGKSKRYYKFFAEHRRIFLDLPGADLTPSLLRNEESLRRTIAMSDKIHDHYSRRLQTEEPSRNPSDYDPGRNQNYGHVVTGVKRFVSEIKKDDLVLVAPRTQYDPILFGVIEGDYNPLDKVLVDPFVIDRFNTRRVRWLPTRISKRDLPANLAMRLENRHTIVEVTAKDKVDALAAAYKTYSTPTTSKVDIECPNYQGISFLETVDVQELASFFAAIYYMHENNIIGEAANKSFREIATAYFEGDLIAHIENEFHSPGHYRIKAKTAAMALFISAGLTLCAAGEFNQSVSNLNLINPSAGESADCVAQNDYIQGLIQSTVNSLSNSTITECNIAGLRAKENLGMKTNAKILP